MHVSRIMPKYSRLWTFGIAILSVGYFLEPDLSEAETNAEYPRTLNALAGLEGSELSVGGFVDTYLAFDLNDPNRRRRDYLTQPSRNEEPNVNLAFLEAKWSTDVSRGRVAVQAGTSVDANYTSEPEQGIRYLQEAVAGFEIAEGLWLDGGVYFSHLGAESFISRDNWAYTRLLASEYSPYYQSGARLTYEVTPQLAVQLHLLNGWQNVSDWNGRPALGTQVKYTFPSGVVLSDSSFIGKEIEGTRLFNDVVVQFPITQALEAAAVVDVGSQERSDGSHDEWWSWAALARLALTPTLKLNARLEQFHDENGAIVANLAGDSFHVSGFSTGIDYEILPQLLWRTEYRWLLGDTATFRSSSERYRTSEQFIVTSLACSF